jgi:hypothetical protein
MRQLHKRGELASPFVKPTVELDDDPVGVVHVEAAHPALGVGKRLSWASEPDALGQNLLMGTDSKTWGYGNALVLIVNCDAKSIKEADQP